ncbi:MAG: hypothetical protein RLZZ460_675, partial [Chloroflexota bacterium]
MTRQARLSITIALATILVAGAPAARASDLWPGAFKSYEQIESEILAVEAAHPEIVDVFSIGQSYEGRELYAAKISDNVTLDEVEPEVLIDALHHSNEHVTLAQALDLLHTLVDGYGADVARTALVDERVVWIVFAVNPDGLAFEFTENGPWNWRKNRQPTPGSSSIGTDLNRNYGAYWRCCNTSTKNPASRIYAGPARFSAPETAAMRDFVASRVINGVQRISIYLSLHAAGRYVAWPIFPRSAGIPSMTIDDRLTMNALVAGVALRNGYEAIRYLPTGGSSTDWMYATYKVPSILMEIGENTGEVTRFYPTASAMASEVAGNRNAILWLIGEANCPSEAAGLGGRRCGPRFDDFEREAGWVVNPDGTDTATSGRFERGRPALVRIGASIMQRENGASGYRALVTGAAAGRTANSNDLDGITTARSPEITLGADPGELAFGLAFSHGSSATTADWFRVWIEAADGTRTLLYQQLAASRTRWATYAT